MEIKPTCRLSSCRSWMCELVVLVVLEVVVVIVETMDVQSTMMFT